MLAFSVVVASFAAAGQPPATPAKSAEGVRPFAEGVRIDWPNLTVEVDAEVVLREGPLELFACSPRTKEHESILRVPARPTHIYQALGLIGLVPGRPVRFDEERDRWEPPTGDGLDIRVRYKDDHGRVRIEAPETWLSTTGPRAAPLQLPWVFAGSYTLPDGRFAADIEGTLVCLVDFEAALIATAALHSADNEQLWLSANTEKIPPRGTKCTLLIRSAHRPPVEVDLVDARTVRYKDQSFNTEQIAKLLRPPPDDNRPARLVIRPAADVSDEVAAEFVRRFRESFVGPLVIETKRALKPGGPSTK